MGYCIQHKAAALFDDAKVLLWSQIAEKAIAGDIYKTKISRSNRATYKESFENHQPKIGNQKGDTQASYNQSKWP